MWGEAIVKSWKSHYRQVPYHAYSTYIQTRNQANRDKKSIKKAQTIPNQGNYTKLRKNFTKILAKRVYDSPLLYPWRANMIRLSRAQRIKKLSPQVFWCITFCLGHFLVWTRNRPNFASSCLELRKWGKVFWHPLKLKKSVIEWNKFEVIWSLFA